MNQREHAPVFDFFRQAARCYRVAGLCDYRVGPALDAYLGHLARCVADGEVTVAEGLTLGNAIVRLAARAVPLPEARLEPRDEPPVPPVPPPAPTRPLPSHENTVVRDAGEDGPWRRPRVPVARPRCPTCTGT